MFFFSKRATFCETDLRNQGRWLKVLQTGRARERLQSRQSKDITEASLRQDRVGEDSMAEALLCPAP